MGKAFAFAFLAAAPLLLAAAEPAKKPETPAKPAMAMEMKTNASDANLIRSAESAAPAAVGKDATIIAINDDGSTRTVRKGTNGFTCMADSPATPGPDPMCADANAMEWIGAWLGHKDPPTGKVGFMYMLEGGTDASNTDPYATKPTAENNWVKTGPHVMVVGDTAMLANYPASPQPDTTKPYVMWSGTPYAHLMVPVK